MSKKMRPGFRTLITSTSPQEDAYDKAIGQFVTRFSEAEVHLLYVAIEYGKFDYFKVGCAALSPMRVDGGITTIKRIIEARQLRTKSAKELLNVLEQLSVINKARNDLMHYGIGPNKVISTEPVSFHRRLVRKRPFAIHIVRQLTADIEDISMYLLGHFAKKLNSAKDLLRPFRRLYPLGTSPVWRYRYTEANSKRGKRTRSTRARV